MRDKFTLSCPKCGNTTFKTRSKINSPRDLNGATCIKCGNKINGDYPMQVVKKELDKMIRDAFKGNKLFKI
ncbi:ECs_2282 family putative zinc-binding protein [Avibacterium avium]|uniref:ECs_2282 family putative zinc-binding protein n=1 Tax=Avibacterium avium TaxID=751 RepID=UPI003BF8B2AB